MTHTTHAPLMTLCHSALTVGQHAASPTIAAWKPNEALSLQQQAAVLENDLTQELARGAQLESRTATVAVVMYPAGQLNYLARLLVRSLRLGLGLFARTVNDVQSARVMLTVDEYGNITRRVLPR
ncbi:MAG: hypothetical protein ACRDTC_05005 [Pseudonocardiaceae bacterium]